MKNKLLLLILTVLAFALLVCSCDLLEPKKPEDTHFNDTSTCDPMSTSVPVGTSEVTTGTEITTGPIVPKDIPVAQDIPSISLNQCFAVVYDEDTASIIFKNYGLDTRIYPASTTKLLTALYALHVCEPSYLIKVETELDQVASDASVAGIAKGQIYTLDQLIGMMLIPSGNDAAYTIAKGVGLKLCDEGCTIGEALLAFMNGLNEYAKEVIGTTNTNFITPDGYHDVNHKTTLMDMLRVSIAAEQNEIIMKYVGLRNCTFNGITGNKIEVKNTNKMLGSDYKYYNKYITGLKTGSTSIAGKCVCVSYDDGVRHYIILVYGAMTEQNRDANVSKIIDYFCKSAA